MTYKIQIRGGETVVRYLGRNADVFDDVELAQAVVQKLERLAKRFSVSKTDDGRFGVFGEQTFFEAGANGEATETVVQLVMRTELEPSVFDDAEVAQLHADRLNDHYAGPTFEVVQIEEAAQ